MPRKIIKDRAIVEDTFTIVNEAADLPANGDILVDLSILEECVFGGRALYALLLERRRDAGNGIPHTHVPIDIDGFDRLYWRFGRGRTPCEEHNKHHDHPRAHAVPLSYLFFIRWKPVPWAIWVQFLPLYAFILVDLAIRILKSQKVSFAWFPRDLSRLKMDR